MTQQLRFLTALKRLQDWHTDSVKARDYDAPASHGGGGHRMLRAQQWPGTSGAWKAWQRAEAAEQRESVIIALEVAYEKLLRRPQVEAYRDYWGKTRYRTIEPHSAG